MAQQAVCPSWSSASKTDPVCGESAVLEPEGVRGAPRAPQVPASPSHGEDAAAVYWGAAAGGNLAAAALAGLLTEQPCKRRGGASGSASPVCRTWEPLSIFFPAAFAPAFALVCLGKPHPRDRGTSAVPPEGREAHPWARGMPRGFLDRGDLGEILSVRPSPSWVSTCFWDVLARGRALLIPPA